MPFTFDKQVLFMETVYSIFGADTIPAGLMNFSDWRAAEAATSTSSKCEPPAADSHRHRSHQWVEFGA